MLLNKKEKGVSIQCILCSKLVFYSEHGSRQEVQAFRIYRRDLNDLYFLLFHSSSRSIHKYRRLCKTKGKKIRKMMFSS